MRTVISGILVLAISLGCTHRDGPTAVSATDAAGGPAAPSVVETEAAGTASTGRHAVIVASLIGAVLLFTLLANSPDPLDPRVGDALR